MKVSRLLDLFDTEKAGKTSWSPSLCLVFFVIESLYDVSALYTKIHDYSCVSV